MNKSIFDAEPQGRKERKGISSPCVFAPLRQKKYLFKLKTWRS